MRKAFLKRKILLALCLGSMVTIQPAYAYTETGYIVTANNITDNSTGKVSITKTVPEDISVFGISNPGYSKFIFSNPAMITLGATSTTSNASAWGIYNGGSTSSTWISGDADIWVTAKGGSGTSASAHAYAYGIANSGGSTSINGDADICVAAKGGSDTSESKFITTVYAIAYGIDNRNSGSISISRTADIRVTATGGSGTSTATSAYAYASGISNYQGSLSITRDTDISVIATGGRATYANAFANATANAQGIYNRDSGSISITGDADITVTAKGGSATSANDMIANAIGISNAGSTSISGDTNIIVTATGGSTAEAYGIANHYGTVDLKRNTTIIATASGGDAHAYSLNANGGTIKINQAEENPYTVKLTGDVLVAGSSIVNLNLNNSSSFLRGNVITKNSGTLNFNLANKAVWEPVYDNRNGTITYDPANYSIDKNTISSLKLSGGTVDLTWDDNTRTAYRQMVINALSGTGGTLKINSDVVNNTGDNFKIGTLNSDAKLNIAVNYDRSLAAVAEPTTLYTSSNYSPIKVTSGEEYLTLAGVTTERGPYSITPHFTGKNLTSLSIGASSNTKAAASVMRGQAQLMQTSVNHLRKRLGDLRESPATETGVWARIFTGEITNDKYETVESAYKGIQMGYDKSNPVKDGRNYSGGAISYTTAVNSFSRGSGDSKAGDITLYHTWIGDSGHYYDLVAKHGRLSSDYHTTDISGNYSSADYHTWSDSLSAEYGYRKALQNGWYIEPQAELTMGHIQGVEYTTSSGMKVRQGGVDRIIGRIGMGVGKELTNGNHLYSSLSLLHEFSGNQRMQADTLTYKQNMGGSWYEFMLGGAAKLSDHSDCYVNVEKLFGGYVGSNWQVNAGCRFSF